MSEESRLPPEAVTIFNRIWAEKKAAMPGDQGHHIEAWEQVQRGLIRGILATHAKQLSVGDTDMFKSLVEKLIADATPPEGYGDAYRAAEEEAFREYNHVPETEQADASD